MKKSTNYEIRCTCCDSTLMFSFEDEVDILNPKEDLIEGTCNDLGIECPVCTNKKLSKSFSMPHILSETPVEQSILKNTLKTFTKNSY